MTHLHLEEAKAKILEFEGLLSAPFTPYSENGKIDISLIPNYVDFLVKIGAKGVFVNGTTGEGLSLTVNERMDIAGAWVKHGKDKLFPIMIHVGANSLRDAQQLASHAKEIKATAIASLPPLYYKSQDNEHIIAYLKVIAQSAGNLPFFLYHIPAFSKVEIDFGDFLPKVVTQIPTFTGIKFTSVNVRQLLKSQRMGNIKLKFLSGYDEVLLPCLSCGVTASIGASYNFMAPLSVELMDAFKHGEMEKALALQQKIAEALEKICSYGQPVSAMKEAMNIISPFYFGNPRLPLIPLSLDKQDQLRHDLEMMEAMEWIVPFKQLRL